MYQKEEGRKEGGKGVGRRGNEVAKETWVEDPRGAGGRTRWNIIEIHYMFVQNPQIIKWP